MTSSTQYVAFLSKLCWHLLILSKVTRHRCSVNAQWAKENSKHHESSARGGAATVVVRSKGARGPKRMASDIKPMPKGLSRRGTLGPTLKKSWDEA